jgi:signal transduction histidine kinase/ligand-binding sensor domain-containing protein
MNSLGTSAVAVPARPQPRQYPAPIEKIYIERFTIDDGLPNNAVRAMVQDVKGFLWIATEDGLCRYDGRKFVAYRHDERDSASICANSVTALFIDSRRNLWVGTDNGLCCFNPRENNFIRYPNPHVRPTERWGVNQIIEDASGYLLVAGVAFGTFVLNPYDGRYTPCSFADEQGRPLVRKEGLKAIGIAGNILWAVGYEGDVFTAPRRDGIRPAKFDSKAKERTTDNTSNDETSKPLPQQTPMLFGEPFRRRVQLYARCVQTGSGSYQQGDTVWMATERGVFALNIRQGILQNWLLADALQRSTGRLQACQAVTKRRNGELWVGTDNGVYVFDTANRLVRRFANDPVDLHTLGSNLIYCFLEDRSGVMWIGEGIYGLNKYTPHLKKFRWYSHNETIPQTLSNNYVRGMAEDRDGNVWIGTQYGGLNRFHRDSQSFTRYIYNPAEPKSLLGSNVWALLQDHTGIMWAGLFEKSGLATFNPKHPEAGFTKFTARGLPSYLAVQVLYEDRAGGIWIGLDENYMFRIRPDRTAADEYKFLLPDGTARSVQVMHQDRTGKLWIGTMNGLCWFDSASQQFYRIRHDPKNLRSLPADFVTFIGETRAGELWVATKGGGIARYDAERNEFERVAERDGLPHNNCYAVLEDDEGFLWISSDNGLCRFNRTARSVQQRFVRFSIGDGLQGKEFNRRSYLKTRAGEIWFGGVNGVNAFFPRGIEPNAVPPLVEVVRLQIDSVSKPLYNLGETVELPHDRNNIRLSLAALEFTEPFKNQYSWYLEGLETSWSNPSTENELVYTNLSPGEYTLHVKAANSDGVWNERGTTLTIIIRPAWWQTWWFRVVAVLAGIGLVVMVVTVRQRHAIAIIERRNTELERVVEARTHEIRVQMQLVDSQAQQLQSINAELESSNWELVRTNELLEEKNKQLQDLNQQKNEILGIVSHDLKNPLNAIIGLSDMMLDESVGLTPEETRTFVEQISKSGDRMLAMVKNLLNANAVESGNFTIALVPFYLPTLVQSVVAQYGDRAAEKSIGLHFEMPPAEREAEVAASTVLADESLTFQVIDNLVSNALKFTPLGKNVFVRVGAIGREEGHLSLDTGREEGHLSLDIGHLVDEATNAPITNDQSTTAPITNQPMTNVQSTSFLRIEIRDEGPGISADDQTKLFGKFARLSAQPTGGEHSTGLGLSIVKRLVEAMNGRVWCESELGKGATFIVELPVVAFQTNLHVTPRVHSVHHQNNHE